MTLVEFFEKLVSDDKINIFIKTIERFDWIRPKALYIALSISLLILYFFLMTLLMTILIIPILISAGITDFFNEIIQINNEIMHVLEWGIFLILLILSLPLWFQGLGLHLIL